MFVRLQVGYQNKDKSVSPPLLLVVFVDSGLFLEYLEKHYLISYLITIYLIKLVMASENEDACKFNPRRSRQKVSMLSTLEFYKEDDRMGVLKSNSALHDFIFRPLK